ncbi:MAG: isopenicillin N synthase family oxygenase, partial [Euryarchaeota archaeon]|nr:isopenicillin N synthase family oxygenase [Euryarchaeota archaeon]
MNHDDVLRGLNSVIQRIKKNLQIVWVLTLIDHGLGAEGALIDTFSTPTTWFRLLHYPPVMVDAPEDVFGSAPHTDFGALTLVAQDSAGGLQVAKGGDEWIDVEPIDGAFV